MSENPSNLTQEKIKKSDHLPQISPIDPGEFLKILNELKKMIKSHEEFLIKISLTNQMAEDTLLNVLLAIRQNESLQAWYPAQKGIQESYVVGSHPLSSTAQLCSTIKQKTPKSKHR